jgi:glucokinase
VRPTIEKNKGRQMILAGDIGGTNTRLAIFEQAGRRLVIRQRIEVKNAGWSDPADILRQFLGSLPRSPRVRVACLGVAGPVAGGRVKLTNLEWTLDEKKLARAIKVPRVCLVNDMVAHAEGIATLRPKDLATLQEGSPVRGAARAIIAPGTGLGEGGLLFDPQEESYRSFPSEGGQCDFSPTDELQIALLHHIRSEIGRCTWEDVLSGPGLRHMWNFFNTRSRFHVEATLSNPAPADITRAAGDGSCRASVATVDLFVSLLGAEAGNLALKFLATNGLYIGGGIPGRILKFLRRPQLKRAFVTKGPREFHKLLRAIPIHVITSNDNALYGAGNYAIRM